MANLAKLAIKLVADMEKAQKDFNSMSQTITSIEKSAKNATPSMKNLTDSVNGLGMMQEAAAKAQEMYDNEPLKETKRLVDEATDSLGTMKSTVENMSKGVADDILHMKPTIANVQKAQGEIQKLKALHAELEKQGHGGLLADSIKQAEANMGDLSNRTVQAQSEANMLKTTLMALNAIPFRVLTTVFSDIVGGMKTFGNEFNERFGGMPARIAQVTAAVTALVVVIGLATAKTTALGVSTSYFMALWKSSTIYQGLGGVITLLNTILGTQIAITAATVAWVAVATLGIGVLIACIAWMVTSWFDNSAAIQESENRMKALEASTQKTIDRWRELNNVAKNALESLMSPAEKLVNKLKEIGEIRKAPEAIKEQMRAVAQQQQGLAQRMAEGNGNGWFAESDIERSRQAEFNRLQTLLEQLTEQYHEMVQYTEEQLAAMEENARIEHLKGQYGSLLEETMTAQETYNDVLARLAEDFEAQRITAEEMATVQENARIKYLKEQYGSLLEETMTAQETYNDVLARLAEDFEAQRISAEEMATVQENAVKQLRDSLGIVKSDAVKLHERMTALADALEAGVISQQEYNAALQKAKEQLDPATQAATEAAKQHEAAQKRLAEEYRQQVDKFRNMGKTPVESFKELSVELNRVRASLTASQFAAAKNKLLADLANGLRVAQYLKDAATPAQQLAETYKNLEIYAREANLTTQELTAAKNRAKEALEKQSEYYSLYLKAQDAMLTTQEKLNRELQRIADEAKKWGWDARIIEKMKELKTEELLGKEKADVQKNQDSSGRNVDQSQNAALEFGTVAYYEKQMKDTNKPLLDETKKQTKQIADIGKDIKKLRTGNRQPGIVIA